jgi:hypothetical protein
MHDQYGTFELAQQSFSERAGEGIAHQPSVMRAEDDQIRLKPSCSLDEDARRVS